MLKILSAACLGLSVVNSAQFALKMCLAVQNHVKKSRKKTYCSVQSHPRSLNSVPSMAIESLQWTTSY